MKPFRALTHWLSGTPASDKGTKSQKPATKQLSETDRIEKRKLRRVSLTKQAVNNLLNSQAPIKLEIGSGPFKGENGWTTLDMTDKADLFWDLSQELPFPDNSVSAIYSSHVLEHFYYPDLMRLLSECLRILKPQGSFSVCVPDASVWVRGYLDHQNFDREKYLLFKPAVVSDAPIDILNYVAYMDGHHRYMFDSQNLIEVLSRAGFTKVVPRDFDPDRDLQDRIYGSIYAVGLKP